MDKVEHFDGITNKDWKVWYGTWKQTAINAGLLEEEWLAFLRPYIKKLPENYVTTVFEQFKSLPPLDDPAARVKAQIDHFEYMMSTSEWAEDIDSVEAQRRLDNITQGNRSIV